MRSLFRTTVLVLILTFFHSFASAQKLTTALELNDYLASFTDSLYVGGQAWGKALEKAIESKNYSSLALYRGRMEKFIERKRIEVVTMKDIGGSEKLRIAMLDFLGFEARMVQGTFLTFEKFNSKTPESEIDKAIALLQDLSATESEFLSEVKKAQIAYAAKNGFIVEEE